MRAIATETTRLGFAPARWEALKATVLDGLAAAHRRAPDAMGLSEDRIFAGTGVRLPREVALAVAAELIRDGTIIREGTGVRLPSHQPKLVAADAAFWRRVEPVLDHNPLRPPSVHEIAQSLREDPKKIEALLVRVARLGLLVRLTRYRFFRPQALRRLGEMAAALGAEASDRHVTAAAFRDRSGVGRNVAIEVLEYFDRVKFTRRIGDAHELVQTVAQAFGGPAA
jgi:selenocysteine-specific elongation factor